MHHLTTPPNSNPISRTESPKEKKKNAEKTKTPDLKRKSKETRLVHSQLKMLGFITPRARRLLLLFLFVAGVLYSLTSLTDTRPKSLESLGTTIQQYFYDDDDSEFLKHYANSNLDISDTKQFKDKVKTHGKYEDAFNKRFQSFYLDLITLMESKRDQMPKAEFIERTEYARDGAFWNKEKLSQYLKMDPKDVQRARAIHQDIYNAIPSSFPSKLYSGDGIVLIGGEKYSWLSILSIKSIRSFGCVLPIEVVIPTEEEYEHDLCEEILPALNCQCVLLYNVLGDEIMNKVKFSGYQYKSLALIASSFENVFLLDSDNILVTNPEKYFESEPFKKTGMLIWPDYWERTTSPHFFEVIDLEINETVQVREGKWPLNEPKFIKDVNNARYHDLKGSIPDLSSESGQLLISKQNHIKTLVLSLFYNLYGPGFFYPLISQGNSGEGDKDTFISGAVRGGEPFYQIKSEIQSFGWFNSKREFVGVSMGQRDPIEDYNQYKEILQKKDGLDGEAKFKTFDTRKASVFTVHANYPKLNPYLLLREKKLINDQGNKFRMYGDIAKFLPKLPKDQENEQDGDHFDFEMVQFRRMKFLLCDLNLSFKYFNEISRKELCDFIDGHIEFLKITPIE